MKPSIIVLLEPALANSDYESKYLPEMLKYLDKKSLDIAAIGSRNSINVIKKEFNQVYSIPVFPTGSNGARFFLGYISYLLLSFIALTRVSQKNNGSVFLSLGGHPYTGLVVSIVAKMFNKKSIVRISEPTRIIAGNRYAWGHLMASFVGVTEFFSFYFSSLIVANRDMRWYHKLVGSKQVILSQGVNVEQFSSTVPAIFNLDRFPRLITVARLDKLKNIKSVIEAVALLIAKYPKTYYYIVGSGPDEKALRNLALRLGVNERVNFFSYASPERIPGLLKSADFFILPSLVEGLPSAVLEAMSCGLPVILASTDYSCQGLFKNEENLLLVSGTAESIADAVDRLASDDLLKDSLAINGQKYVRACHNSSMTKKRFVKTIKQLLDSD